MEFIENLFARENIEEQNLEIQESISNQENELNFNNEIELKSQLDEEKEFSDKYIRNILKRSDVKLADYKVYDKVKNLYVNVLNDAIQNVNKITFHRRGNVVNESDMYLMENLSNQNMFGGTGSNLSYMGYCDNNPGQCADSFSGSSSGSGGSGGSGNSGPQCGGDSSSFCDGHPSQCGDVTQQGGFIEFKNQNIFTKNKGILSKREFIRLAKEKSQYKITNKALTKLQQFVENEVVNYINNQKEEQESNIFNNLL